MADLASNLNPDRITSLKDGFDTTITKFENGAEQRFANRYQRATEYEITWVLVDSTTLDSIRAFFNTQAGQYSTWTINDSRLSTEDVTVRFTVDELNVEPVKWKGFTVKAKIKLM